MKAKHGPCIFVKVIGRDRETGKPAVQRRAAMCVGVCPDGRANLLVWGDPEHDTDREFPVYAIGTESEGTLQWWEPLPAPMPVEAKPAKPPPADKKAP